MTYAVDPNETREVTLDGDANLPEEERPVFLLRPLTTAEKKVTATRFGNIQHGHGDAGEFAFETVRYALAGWRRFRTRSGEDVPFRTHGNTNRPMATDATLGRIPMGAILDLSTKVVDFEYAKSEDDEGKFSSPSPSSAGDSTAT